MLARTHIGLAAAAAAAVMFGGTAQARELVYSTHNPDTHSDNTVIVTPFFERIDQETASEDTVKIMGGGVLAGAAQALGALGQGAVDYAMLIYSYTPGELPAIAFLGDLYTGNSRVAAAAKTETMLLHCPDCLAEMERNNVYIPNTMSTGSYSFLCRDQFVLEPGDAKGLKIRGTGSMGALAAGLGATVVSIPYNEAYNGIQTGAIDCTMLDAGNLEAAQFWEVTKAVSLAPLGTFSSLGGIAVNKDLWDSYDAKTKKAWYNSSAVALAEYAKNSEERIQRAITIGTAEHGVVAKEASQALLDEVTAFRKAEISGFVETAKARGVADPLAIADAYEATRQKWQVIVDEIGTGEWNADQYKVYADRVKAEIYDKLPVE